MGLSERLYGLLYLHATWKLIHNRQWDGCMYYGTWSLERPIPLSNMTNPVGQDAVILSGNGFYQGLFYSATRTPHSGFMLQVERHLLTIYLPSNYLFFLPIDLYMRPSSYRIWLPRWNQMLTESRFIHNWVTTAIQWMVHWWVLVQCGPKVALQHTSIQSTQNMLTRASQFAQWFTW
jgi:hypothetical protein